MKSFKAIRKDIDSLVQDCSNSIANALELLQFCTKPSISSIVVSPMPAYGPVMPGARKSAVTDMTNTVVAKFGTWRVEMHRSNASSLKAILMA